MSNQFEVFLTDEALKINKARQDHLAALGLQLAGKTVLEVGAGIGLHTQFFEDLGCSVLTTDGRPENVIEIRRRYPYRQTQVLDLETTTDLTSLGTFDIIYCYGTLYHLSQPEPALKAMAQVCRELILLETCVTPGNTLDINPITENLHDLNQAYSGIGCRPTRPWVMAMLRQYFGFAYVSKYQPSYPDFELNWSQPLEQLLHRAVFVGSKQPLEHNKLLELLPDYQQTDPDTHRIWIDVGAHLGQTTLPQAKAEPDLTVYAFEPNTKLAAQITDVVPNYVVIPAAIASQNGLSQFHINADDATSSLLPFDQKGLQQWIGGEQLQVKQVTIVPTIRLDTLLNQRHIRYVDYLKIDSQGGDFEVIQSAGERLKDIGKIKLEVAITSTQLYAGAHSKDEIIDYLVKQGFILIKTEKQSYDQEENLTFIHWDYPQKLSSFDREIWTELNNQIAHMEPISVLALAESLASSSPLQLYPGWHFNIDWNSPKPQIQLRRAIWEYFKAKQAEQKIQFNWHFGLKIELYLANDLSSQLFVAGYYDPNEFYCLDRILRPGMTFLDIGANDGLYALFAAKAIGSAGLVWAFEPSPREFNRLQANIALNEITNIQAVPIALANINGNTELRLANNEHAGQNTLGQFMYEGVASPQTETIPVPVKRLDDWLVESGIQQVDVIKMDVEGAEFSVLQGAQHCLTTYHPLLLLELADSALQAQGSSANGVLEFLKSLGYEFFTFGSWTGLPIQFSGQLVSSNLVAVHPNRAWIGFTEADKVQATHLELTASQAEIDRLQQILVQTKVQLQEAQGETERIQGHLQQTQANLQQTQADLQHVSLTYEQVTTEKEEVHTELGKTRAELIEMHERLHQAEIGLFAAQAELEKTREKIAAMESSKFWQLRTKWVQFKRQLNLPTTD
ncbi:FkbM family methyltransferase [Pantanalinema sp. GBBB05]|uniref:FkbM family methyltransferase n=1 Tax=Pantanalinema sp. GBBB05 TaxID=2604139 RepID=UPI001DEB291A|nr:FkbM family methyltransferase [Pantanalinema sp. GBBB05]